MVALCLTCGWLVFWVVGARPEAACHPEDGPCGSLMKSAKSRPTNHVRQITFRLNRNFAPDMSPTGSGRPPELRSSAAPCGSPRLPADAGPGCATRCPGRDGFGTKEKNRRTGPCAGEHLSVNIASRLPSVACRLPRKGVRRLPKPPKGSQSLRRGCPRPRRRMSRGPCAASSRASCPRPEW